jgi:hypothetical protein
VFGFHYTKSGQAHKPNNAVESPLPMRTLVFGHNDLSTGGVPRHDPDNHVILTQVTEPATIHKRRKL